MALITNIEPIDPTTFEFQEYSNSDVNLINVESIESSFTQNDDYIEYHVYDLSNQLIFSEVEFNAFRNFRLLDNNLVLDPLQDIQNLALDGTYNAIYNFLNPLLGSNSNTRYYISEISSDRTEIRLDTTQISLTEANQGRTVEGTGVATGGAINEVTDFISRFNLQPRSSTLYPDFYLNFGENQLALAVNIQLDESDPVNPTILIKLYEPLPPQFDLKTELWVVEKIAEPVAFQVENTETFDLTDLNTPIAGPNINLPVKDQLNNSTEAKSLNDLQTSYTASVTNQLLSSISQSGVTINVDYTEYENFVFFSSAQTRLDNFKTKLGDLELLEASASLVSASSVNPTSSLLVSEQVYRNQITDIITNFDGYEYFLYFTSGSKAWPKSNTQPPFSNVTVASTEGTNFYDTQSISASLYDGENDNELKQAIPEYIREDSQNLGFDKFVDMVGQHFDSIKLYQDAVTEKYNTNPSLTSGLSKDLVGDAIKDFGLKLYQSSFTNQELFSYVLGVGTSGSILPPTGSEVITNYISASNDNIPVEDVIKGNYKKIYHALPSLLKRKGTLRGLRELINTFGVPDTVLRISEFGGKDKIAIDDYDYSENKFNFALQPTSDGSIKHIFRSINNDYPSSNITPQSWVLRINPGKLPTSSIPYSQSIAINRDIFGSPVATGSFALVLEYAGSGYATSSIPSSSISSSYQFADLKLIVSGSGSVLEPVSASVSLPFYDGGWWSIMVRHENTPELLEDTTYSLFAKNDIPTENGTKIGFQASSSVIGRSWQHASAFIDYPSNATSRVIAGKTYTNSQTLQYQEIRWYALPLSESSFNNFVTNPYSIEGNTLEGDQSSQNILTFRAPLGTMLDYDTPSGSSNYFLPSTHPAATKFVPISSWEGGVNYENNYEYVNPNNITTVQNTERIYLDSPGVGIKSRNSDKIRAINLVAPTGSALSQYITIEQSSPISESYTPDVDYLEVGFSPSNELNDDMIAQLGNFNIGDFIGDPRQASSSNTFYPDFNRLKDQYFEKYQNGSLFTSSVDVSYNVYDFIRLAKFFDNSLFKMIKDFVPARTSLSTGVIVKPHILERTKYPQPQATFEELLYTGSVKSFPLGYETGSLLIPSGGDGGFLNLTPNDFTQSFTYSITTPSGSLIVTQSDKREFITGEYSGSQLTVEDGELNPDNPFKKVSNTPVNYLVVFTSGSEDGVTEGTASVNYRMDTDFTNKYVFNSITFNNIDANGVDQQQAIRNLTKNDTIDFNLPSDFAESNVRGIVTSTLRATDTSSRAEFDRTFNPAVGFSVGLVTFPLENQDFRFNPYLPGVKFDYNDNNALLGNATQDRESSIYFDVDYSTSQLSAVNLQLILSGSATRAQTPDSNYSLARSIRPRYEGSKNTDPVPLQIVTEVAPGAFISSSGPYDRQLIQSTSSLAPINNYVSAIVEYEDISISGSDNKLQNERVPNNIIFIDSLNPGETSEKTKSEAVLELENQIEDLQNQLAEFTAPVEKIDRAITRIRNSAFDKEFAEWFTKQRNFPTSNDILEEVFGLRNNVRGNYQFAPQGKPYPRSFEGFAAWIAENSFILGDYVKILEKEKRELLVNRGRVNEKLISLENRLEIILAQNFFNTNISGFSTLAKGSPSFFPTIQQIFKKGDSVNLLSYEASSIIASGSIPLVTRTVAGFSSSIETIVFEDKRPFPPALFPTGKGAIFSTFSSPVINRNIIDITKQIGNNGDSVIVGNQITQLRGRGD